MEAAERRLKRHLKSLTSSVRHHIAALDRVIREPESVMRGKKVAQLANILEMENDKARYFGLGIDFWSDRKKK